MAMVQRLGATFLRGTATGRAAAALAPRGVGNAMPLAPWAMAATRFFASDLKFAKTHEWVRFGADGVAVLGISDFAQGALGEVVYCDLPAEGATFKDQETIVTLESVKAVGEVYAPGECEVVAVNDTLTEEPAKLNSSPEEDGWLVKLKFTSAEPSLMDRAAYEEHIKAEADESQ